MPINKLTSRLSSFTFFLLWMAPVLTPVLALAQTMPRSGPHNCTVGEQYYSGSYIFNCTAPNVWTVNVPGTGGGVTPSLTFSPTPTLTFPSTNVDTSAAPLSITVTNTALAYFAISSVTITGLNAGDFTQTNTCGASIPSGNNCTVTITFTPTVTGAGISWSEAATLNIIGAATFSDALVGTGQVLNGGLILTASGSVVLDSQTITYTTNRPVTWGTPAVGTLTATDTTHATYTAPASIATVASEGGCQTGPGDSVLNTNISALPVHAESSAWLAYLGSDGFLFEPSWNYNILTASSPTTEAMKFYYGQTSGSYPALTYPFNREGGQMTGNTGGQVDHHTLTVTTHNCHFFEVYGRPFNLANTYTCSNGTTGCDAQSGSTYAGTDYALTGDGTTGSNLPLVEETQIEEIKNNTIHHAQLVTMSVKVGVLWPASPVDAPAFTYLPYGARLRLKSSFVTSSYSTYAQNILNGWKHYGMIFDDIGNTGGILWAPSIASDPVVLASVREAMAAINFTNIEVVDESSLMLDPASNQVNPANGYVTPVNSGYFTATDTTAQSDGNKYSVHGSPSLQGVVIGVPHTQLTMIPGSYSYTLPSWVTGSTNQTVTWALTSGVGSLSGAVYTPPTSVSSQSAVVLTATAAADTAIHLTQYINLIPVGADGNTRISSYTTTVADSEASPGPYTWATAIGTLDGNQVQTGPDFPAWLTTSLERSVYLDRLYNYGNDLHFQLIVPNGNYQVRFLWGQSNLNNVQGGSFPAAVPGASNFIGTGSNIIAHTYAWGAPVAFQRAAPWDYYAPAVVTNNLLDAYYGEVVPDGVGQSNTTYESPSVNGMEFIPDATAAHIGIDTGMESWSTTAGVPTVTTLPLIVEAGSTAQLYGIGWYMASTVTWGVSGGGSISSTGLYTSPATKPTPSPLTITVTATSTVDITKTATATLTIPIT
jgi:hypothetical protein